MKSCHKNRINEYIFYIQKKRGENNDNYKIYYFIWDILLVHSMRNYYIKKIYNKRKRIKRNVKGCKINPAASGKSL